MKRHTELAGEHTASDSECADSHHVLEHHDRAKLVSRIPRLKSPSIETRYPAAGTCSPDTSAVGGRRQCCIFSALCSSCQVLAQSGRRCSLMTAGVCRVARESPAPVVPFLAPSLSTQQDSYCALTNPLGSRPHTRTAAGTCWITIDKALSLDTAKQRQYHVSHCAGTAMLERLSVTRPQRMLPGMLLHVSPLLVMPTRAACPRCMSLTIVSSL